MSAHLCVPRPTPWVNKGPPACAATFDSWRSRRGARGPRLLTTGTAYAAIGAKQRQN